MHTLILLDSPALRRAAALCAVLVLWAAGGFAAAHGHGHPGPEPGVPGVPGIERVVGADPGMPKAPPGPLADADCILCYALSTVGLPTAGFQPEGPHTLSLAPGEPAAGGLDLRALPLRSARAPPFA